MHYSTTYVLLRCLETTEKVPEAFLPLNLNVTPQYVIKLMKKHKNIIRTT